MVCVDEEHQYCPEMALSTALHDWMEELSQPLQPGCVCVCFVVLKRSQLGLISTVHPDVDSDRCQF
jgi:hypothetical protein